MVTYYTMKLLGLRWSERAKKDKHELTNKPKPARKIDVGSQYLTLKTTDVSACVLYASQHAIWLVETHAHA